jgi:erythromycin esterase
MRASKRAASLSKSRLSLESLFSVAFRRPAKHPVARRRCLSGAKAPPPADVGKDIGLSLRAQELKLVVKDFAAELQVRGEELVTKSDRGAFDAALHDISVAEGLLGLHAALARRVSLDDGVSMRDKMQAEHLVYVAEREEARGKLLVHLHNAHLRRTRTKLPWYEFLPTGAHLERLLGARFAVIGGALGTSEENSVAAPEAGSLEARFLARQSDFFLPVWRAKKFPEGALAALPVRTGSKHPLVTYTPLFEQSATDLDGIAFLRSSTFTRGMQPNPPAPVINAIGAVMSAPKWILLAGGVGILIVVCRLALVTYRRRIPRVAPS